MGGRASLGVADDGPPSTELARLPRARRPRARTLGTYAMLTVAVTPFMLPLYWLLIGVFKTPNALVHTPPYWLPPQWTLSNLHQLVSSSGGQILLYARNSFEVAGFTVIATLVSSSLAAYGFSQFEFRGRNALFWVVIVTLIIPGWATIVPQYQLFSWLHWVGTLRPLMFPAVFGDPFSIFLIRQYMLTIPRSMKEAARCDGASELRIWWSIMMPIARPAVVVAGVFAFINSYNDFFGPLIYLTNPNDYTLPLGAFQFVEAHGALDLSQIVPYIIIVVLPLVVLFSVAQRQILSGVRLGDALR
jgi:multiple sugar transport system permease protein